MCQRGGGSFPGMKEEKNEKRPDTFFEKSPTVFIGVDQMEFYRSSLNGENHNGHLW